MSDDVAKLAGELGFEFAGISGHGKRKFYHPVTKKTVFASEKTAHGRALQNALSDLRRSAGHDTRGREAVRAERVERQHKRINKVLSPKLFADDDRLAAQAKRETEERTLKEQLGKLFKEADNRHLSPEQAISFAFTYLKITYKNFGVTMKEVRDAYDADHRTASSHLYRKLQPALRGRSRGGWYRFA